MFIDSVVVSALHCGISFFNADVWFLHFRSLDAEPLMEIFTAYIGSVMEKVVYNPPKIPFLNGKLNVSVDGVVKNV